jgi:hypothetical protein
LSQSKNLIAFSASSKTKFVEWKSFFGVAQNVWDWQKMYVNFWSGQQNLDQPKIVWNL